MSDIQSLPSYNPSDTQSFEGGMRIFQNHLLKLIEHSIPCVVQSYDLASNTVTVMPAVKLALTTGEYMQRSVIKVTAWKLHGGGFQIHYPIKAGDTGWLIAADTDTSLFKQEKSVSDPNTYQKHKYQFGYYLPDKINGFNISNDDKDRLVLQNDAGTEKISIGQVDIKIKSLNVIVDTLSMNATNDVDVAGTITAANIIPANGYSGTVTVGTKVMSFANGILISVTPEG